MTTRIETQEQIRTKDGQTISRLLYLPDKPNGSAIIIGPSAVFPQIRYKQFAEFLMYEGFVVVTFDYRGIGQSLHQSLRGYKATLTQWGIFDLDAIILNTKNLFPKSEIIFIGHQISGEIITMAPSFQFINRIVLVSSGLSSWKLWPLRDRLSILCMKGLMPIVNRLFGYFPGGHFGFMANLPAEVAQEWTTLCNYPNGLFEVLTAKNHQQYFGSILSYSFSDDWLAPPKSIDALLKQFPNAQIEKKYFTPQDLGAEKIKHFGFFYPNAGNVLWDDLLEWLQNRLLA